MDEVIKLVKTYRLTRGLAERLELADRILLLIQRDLRFFVFGAVRPPAAEDVFQKVLIAVHTSLGSFKGSSTGEFRGWCYGIAWNKVKDQYGKQAADRLRPMPDEELWRLIEASVKPSALSPADRHDLEYALKLLGRSKPECREYLWSHFVIGLDYAEIAAEEQLSYDNVRMRIGRCLEEAQGLVS